MAIENRGRFKITFNGVTRTEYRTGYKHETYISNEDLNDDGLKEMFEYLEYDLGIK